MRNYLSPKIEGRPSSLEGWGLFAREFIHAGETIKDAGIGPQKLISKKEADELYSKGFDYMIQVEDDTFLVTVTNPEELWQGYLNHSCEPNCGFQGPFRIVTMRDISPGEELTFDYAMSESSEYSMDCNCQKNICRKTVTGEDWKLPELKERYEGYFSDYLKRRIENT